MRVVRAVAAPVVAAVALVALWPVTFWLSCGDTCEAGGFTSLIGVPLPDGLGAAAVAVSAAVLLATAARVALGPAPRPSPVQLAGRCVLLPLAGASAVLLVLYPVTWSSVCRDGVLTGDGCRTEAVTLAGLHVGYPVMALLPLVACAALVAWAAVAARASRRTTAVPAS
ncbi:hypothetical protein [Aquipuribacter sp. SD81]|uniref:hypothetical protein n=1 Tax=Aquipuribacter sp. SD81 TaxID=3127703 RepID=UPI003017DAAD